MKILIQCHTAGKCKTGTLWTFSTSILIHNMKKMKRDLLETLDMLRKKSHSTEKKIERWNIQSGLVWHVMLKRRKNYYGSVPSIHGSNGTLWQLAILYNVLQLFWSVRVHWGRSHYYIRVSLHETPTENNKNQTAAQFRKTTRNILASCSFVS